MSEFIPIRNLYYLLCYAWDRLTAFDLVELADVRDNAPQDLLARVLRAGVVRAMRRGLDRQYVGYEEDLEVPRGKIGIGATIKRNLEERSRLACLYDDLTLDIPHNRILKATLGALARVEGLDPSSVRDLATLKRRMGEVSDIAVTPRSFRDVRLHRNNAHYGLLMDVCELFWRHVSPDSHSGKLRFRDFRGSDQEMGLVFEAFVRNFLRREQKRLAVCTEDLGWVTEEGATGAEFLPRMRTDISLRCGSGAAIIEAKFYRQTLQTTFGSEKVRSQHLYQLLTYVRAKTFACGGAPVLGVLLYPRVDRDLDLRFELLGHVVRVRTLDLAAEWHLVRDQLLQLAGCLAEELSFASRGKPLMAAVAPGS